MSGAYFRLVDIRSDPSLLNVGRVHALLNENRWESASARLEDKKPFVWRIPRDPTNIGPEHRLERRLLTEVRTVALPGRRGGVSTVTFLAAAFPVGRGKRGQIDLLGISNVGGVVVVELKHNSNDAWCAVVETGEYLLRLRANYGRVASWMRTKCGSKVGDMRSSSGLVIVPRGLNRRKSKEYGFANVLADSLRDKMGLAIHIREMEYEGLGRQPQMHRLTILKELQ